jgi:hypothetical protein
MVATKPPSLQELARYPKMTSWFQPVLLAKLLWRVVVSDLFGQYADGRLIVAALDPVSELELVARAKQFASENANDEVWAFTPDASGSVWIDYVADLGDGFDSTYAIASLLAQDTLTVGGHLTRRGQLLVMGGDEVYPNASFENYQQRLQDPYAWAFPDPDPSSIKGPPVYAIPGNHDWYDGLVLFLSLFSRKEHLHLGGWRSHQRRSYFALQLTDQWWIWGVDAQLDDHVDQPQQDYFAAIARGMPKNVNIILCGPEPGWLYTLRRGSKSLSVIDLVATIAINANKGLKVPIVLSGDTHHYSRYAGDDGVTQFITSGGGGAFLHPTHQLAPMINVDRASDGFCWLHGQVKTLTLGTDPNFAAGPAPRESLYPTRRDSIAMLAGNFKFVRYNPGFAMLLGALYWLVGLATQNLWPDVLYLAPAVLCFGFWRYTRKQEGGGLKVSAVSLGNGLIHGAIAISLALLCAWTNERWLRLQDWPRTEATLFAAEMIVGGGIIAAALFGLYLYVGSRWWGFNHNDAFSAMRRNSHRNFLRLRIKGDEVTIYPVGLDRSPRRREWRENAARAGSPAPVFVPTTPLDPRLIEGPIVVRS